MRSGLCCLLAMITGTVAAIAAEPERTPPPTRLEATSQASPPGGKYAVESAVDDEAGTHWASANKALPQSIRMTWDEPVSADAVSVTTVASAMPALYASWRRFELRLDNGVVVEHTFTEPADVAIVRLEGLQTFRQAELVVHEVFEPRTYIGLRDLGFYRDPDRLLAPVRQLARPLPRTALTVTGRPEHPCVYLTPKHIALGRRNAESTTWGAEERARVLKECEFWMQHDEGHWLEFLPEPGACYAYGFTGCPICGASFGTWGGARCAWDKPGQVVCGSGHSLPDAAHPDDGTGYKAEDGRFHYFKGIWNSWVTEQWTQKAIPSLSYAYALTGDERYAERAAFFLDALASIYAESTAGSWDYPSSPPSGRFARPWYQVARTLVVFVEAYDLIYSSAVLDRPSLRPGLAARRPEGPTAQQRGVGRQDAFGMSRPDLTRRQNIDENLMIDGAQYCYEQTFHIALHNGHADYMRGALAVGALLGIETYVNNAIESPCSIWVMLANNADRDGRYFETALGYALHARSLYLTFVEPLLHWRSATYPEGVNLFDDARMRSFYALPALTIDCAGHAPNFGDAAPDNTSRYPTGPEHSSLDAHYAEWLYAYGRGEHRDTGARLLAFLSQGDSARLRQGSQSQRWLLFRAEDLPADASPELPADLRTQVTGSWVMGQKGMAILRDGQDADAQAALLRYGPSLNHGDYDDLGLIYYAKGWQMTYEIGYGLGSTHCQVGWGSQTVSHCLVTVNEKSQGGASGGSLNLFAELPSLRLVEAESPLSYSRQGVSQYRRTVALVGSGADQVLVDLFRVRGGRQHDYSLGVQTQAVSVNGLEVGPEEDGSLAGDGIAWGEAIGLDGDVKGYPNKPYWNPPPGNGYGFFYDPRRAPASRPFQVDFDFGDARQTRLRVHALPEAGSEAILAKAPGLYPHNRNAAYLLLRRVSPSPETPLQSSFAVVMEPGGQPPEEGIIQAAALQSMLVDTPVNPRYLAGNGLLFFQGEKAGDAMTVEVPAAEAGAYRVVAGLIRSPSYGTVRLLVDGEPLGEAFTATAPGLSGPDTVVFGTRELTAGPHRLRFETVEGVRLAFGLCWVKLAPAAAATPVAAPAAPILDQVDRVAVDGDDSHMTPMGVHLRRLGRDEYLFSASPEDDALRTAVLPGGTLTWRGAVVFLALRDGRVETAATHGAWDVTYAGQRLGPAQGRHTGKVVAIDDAAHTIDIDSAIPADGIGRIVVFRNPAFSRDTAFRIVGLAALPDGRTRLDLGTQPILLGRGRVHQRRAGNTLTSDVPHEFARGVLNRTETRFFEGKRISNGRGAESRIRRLIYEEPMRIEVENADGFAEGDTLFYYDVSLGDEAIVTTAWEGTPAP